MSPKTWNEAAHLAAAKITRQAKDWKAADQDTLLTFIGNDMDALRSDFTSPDSGIYRDMATCLAAHALVLLVQRTGEYPAELADEIADLAARKHHDYGTSNIQAFGLQGLIVRTSDKVERLKNLLNRDTDGLTESLEDTLRDLVGYAIVGLLWVSGEFYLPLDVDVEPEAKLISFSELKFSDTPVQASMTIRPFDELRNPLLAVNRDFNELVRSQGKSDGPQGLQALIDKTNDPRPWDSRPDHDSKNCHICKQSALASLNFRVDL